MTAAAGGMLKCPKCGAAVSELSHVMRCRTCRASLIAGWWQWWESAWFVEWLKRARQS